MGHGEGERHVDGGDGGDVELQISCRGGKVVLQGVGRSWGQVRVFVNILREEKSGLLNLAGKKFSRAPSRRVKDTLLTSARQGKNNEA